MNLLSILRRVAVSALMIALMTRAGDIHADTVKLKTGAVLEGDITEEDAASVTIVTEHAGGTIFRPEIVQKSDVAEIIHLTAAERRQRDMLRAYGKIQGLRLQGDGPAPLTVCNDVIENYLRPFLEKYPDSPYAAAVEDKLTKWEQARDRTIAAATRPPPAAPPQPMHAPGTRTNVPATRPERISSETGVQTNLPSANAEKEFVPAPLDWRFEAWLVAAAAIFCLHVLCLLWVNRAAKSISAAVRRWNTFAFVLPGVGTAAFAVFFWITRKGRFAPPPKESSSEPSKTPSHFKAQKAVPALAVLDAAGGSVAVRTDGQSKPVFDVVRSVLALAIDKGASDIHIEPTDNDTLMRLRVDGSFLPKQLLGHEMGPKIIASLKTFANVDVADRRKSQDGRFQVNYGGRVVDFRLATSNSIYGENVVLRLLDRSTGIKSLEALGMSEKALGEFQTALKQPGGMILVAGPTGSGKTTTVYAALSRFDPAARKIVTVEDPVEYELSGATQIPVNAKAGVSYEEGLKSVMRQDPDIILVGEMRSKEAAEIAIRAALTGHLVFSTIHAPSALGTIMRLRDMGIEPYLISSAVIAVVSQRLVRRLCPDCKQPAAPDSETQAALGGPASTGPSICRAVGCERCGGTGFRGRIGVFEILSLNAETKRMIVAGASEEELFHRARHQGMRTMKEDVHAKILEGITTLQEAAISMKA